MTSSLEEDPGYGKAHETKDVLKLRIVLRTVTFHYRKTEEPIIKTLFKCNKEFISLHSNIAWT